MIDYAVSAPAEGALQFLSDASAGKPRYRLTYRKSSAETVALKFEIAPPGKPDTFTTYIEATVRRQR